MTPADDTICAIATPPGEGGIGIVRLSGAHARAILEQLFRNSRGGARTLWPPRRLILGTIVDPSSGDSLDQVLAVFMPGPHSYTGEDVVEIHGHGGPAPLRRIVDAALRLGARSPQPGEFTRRAWLNGRIDLAQAEAVIDVIRARTDLALRTALSQYSGKLSARVHRVTDLLLDWIAQLEATLDFPEDDIPSVSTTRLIEGADKILHQLDALLADAEHGRILRDGVRVAIVGRPNVGKSSLLNALLGETRAIVTEVPGTTRDSIEEWLNIEGIPMRIVDTAGIRHSEDRVEAIGIGRAREWLQAADLALFVVDGSQPLQAEDREIDALSHERPRIVVVNKCDAAQRVELDAFDGSVVVRVSALTGDNVPALTKAMAAALSQGLSISDGEIGGNLRHRDALYRAREHVGRARSTAVDGLAADFVTIDLRAAVEALGEITGTSITDEVIARIFTQFCLGK